MNPQKLSMGIEAQMYSRDPLLIDNNNNFIIPHQPQLEHRIIDNHRAEIDIFLNSQNEILKLRLQEQTNHQAALLMKNLESKVQTLINQKEVEICRAAMRTSELQDFLRRLEAESQAWRRAAQENEEAVASLNGAIGRLMRRGCEVDDAQSSCCGGDDRKMICRRCGCRNLCVILLPCRHLCCCRECDSVIHSCPICGTPKEASVQAFI